MVAGLFAWLSDLRYEIALHPNDPNVDSFIFNGIRDPRVILGW